MGECSKKIGEFGEKVVFDNLLNEIGWGDAQKNVSMPCVHGTKHAFRKLPRTTHGIDAFFSYPSRLIDRTLDHLIISVKYTSGTYPDSPVSKFKNHFFDLTQTIECFRKSELRSNAGKNFSGVTTARNIGILFWLTNNRVNNDIVSKLNNCRGLDEFSYETVFVVDDYKAAFLHDSICFLRKKYSNDTVEFMHPNTGKNINSSTRETASKVLSVEYINSPVIPFSITSSDNKKTLALSCSDNFAIDNLRRLLGLARDITTGFASSTLLLYPDYDQLQHNNFVQEAKSGFGDKRYTESVSVACFRDDFRELK